MGKGRSAPVAHKMGGSSVTMTTSTANLLSKHEYQRASTNLLTLKAGLPRDAVISMARDVIEQLARRVTEPASRSDAVIDLSKALVGQDPFAAADQIEAHHKAGVATDALLLGYLAPAARQLGEWWTADEITFADVTVGTGRIYGIMRTLRRFMPLPVLPIQKAALVASVPGETHMLGVRMAADLLREKGWDIDIEVGLDHDTMIDRIEESGHLVIGVSAAGDHALASLAKMVLGIQVRCPRAAILVSGNIVAEAGESVALMGVDGMSQNFAEASKMLDQMWDDVSASTA